MGDDNTTPRTIWTETLLELLVKAVERGQDDESRKLLREIKSKGYRKAAVLHYAGKHLDQPKAKHLDALVASMGRRRSNSGGN